MTQTKNVNLSIFEFLKRQVSLLFNTHVTHLTHLTHVHDSLNETTREDRSLSLSLFRIITLCSFVLNEF